MDELTSAEWVETHTQYPDPEHTHLMRYWVRFDPPAEAWRGAFDTHDIVDERGHLHTAASWEDCVLYPSPNRPTREGLLRKVVMEHLPVDEGAGELSQGVGTWRCERVELDGRPAVRYAAEYAKESFRVAHAVWFDPETRRVLRREREETDPLTGQVVLREVCHQYRYNHEAPAGTFDLPPSGKSLVRHERGDLWPDVTKTLPESEREQIEEAIRSSGTGWATDDFADFGRCWRFESGPGLLPSEADWEARVEQQRGRWDRWESRIVEIRRMDRLVVATASHSFRSVERPGVLRVKVALRVGWGGAGVWEGDAAFQVIQEPEGYRILHWECPFEEIRSTRGR
jgi:hypothetical protein